MKKNALTALFSTTVFLALSYAALADTAPVCISGSQVLSVDNALAVQRKEDHDQYPNGTTYRGNISGVITKLYADQTCHTHFEIALDGTPSTTIEVIYDQGFGSTPKPAIGMSVQACGDFIISYSKENGYAASPDGALIHWIHATDTSKHDAGFLILGDTLCGQDIGSSAGLGPTCKK
jgi:hypothetical protein